MQTKNNVDRKGFVLIDNIMNKDECDQETVEKCMNPILS